MKSLKDSINYVLRSVISQKSKVLAEIVINWPRIVGTELSELSYPLKIYSTREKGQQVNVLIVKSESSAAGLKLSYQQELIIERIAVYFGHKAVHRLKINNVI